MGLFKKIGKGITSIAKDPIGKGNIYSMITGKSILDIGKSEGPQNPYAPPDPSGLQKTDVKNPYMDSIMKDLTGAKSGSFYDYYKAPETTAKGYMDYYKAPTETAGGYFDQYIQNINAPSSVDEVRREVEGQRYQDTLRDIGRATDIGMGRGVKGYLGRGLAGDGADSDITRIGLAQIAGQGQEAGARATLDYRGKELDRVGAREEAARGAYGERYRAGVATDSQMRQIAAQAAAGDQNAALQVDSQMRELAARAAEGDKNAADELARWKIQMQGTLGENQANRNLSRDTSYYDLLANLYTGGANRQQAGEKGGYLDSMLRNINLSVPIPV